MAQEDGGELSQNDPPCNSFDCPKFSTSGLSYEGYNDVHHFPFSGQEGHAPSADWAFIPRSDKPPSLAELNSYNNYDETPSHE